MRVTLRDWLAIEAMKMLWGKDGNGYQIGFPTTLCEEAYRIADGMLSARIRKNANQKN